MPPWAFQYAYLRSAPASNPVRPPLGVSSTSRRQGIIKPGYSQRPQHMVQLPNRNQGALDDEVRACPAVAARRVLPRRPRVTATRSCRVSTDRQTPAVAPGAAKCCDAPLCAAGPHHRRHAACNLDDDSPLDPGRTLPDGRDRWRRRALALAHRALASRLSPLAARHTEPPPPFPASSYARAAPTPAYGGRRGSRPPRPSDLE